MSTKDQGLSGGFPYGVVALLIVALFLYAGFVGNIAGSRGTDAAGRGMALGFGMIIGGMLWVVPGGLLVLAYVNGRMPSWAAAAAVVLLPLSAVAAAAAVGLAEERGRWLMMAPFLLPPLLALYALWARLPGWHGVFPLVETSAVLGGAITVLTVVPLLLGAMEIMPDADRDAAIAEQRRAREEEMRLTEQRARQDEEARFARLGSDSSLRDYLEYLPPGHPRSQEALARARTVKSRNVDAMALLREGRIGDLQDLWQMDIDPAAVCDAYGAALLIEAAKIDRARSDFIAVAIDLERQLPNIKWLAGARCDLREAIAAVEARLRALSDSPRLVGLADALASIR